MKKYSVSVGNIGNIPCSGKIEALKTFDDYVKMSKSGKGRGGNESVILLCDLEPIKEYNPNSEYIDNF